MTDISVVVVNWNTRRLLAECLGSLFEANAAEQWRSGETPKVDGLSAEVLVVDNASADGSAQMVREQFPWVRLFANDENLGFARGNNLALRQAKGRYLVLLNPDTQIEPGTLAKLVGFLEARPEVGTVGPLILNSDGSLQPSCTPTPRLSRELWRLFHLDAVRPYGEYRMEHWDRTRPRRVDDIMGACMVISRTVLDRVGLFDEDYFIYSEEVDLCLRIRRAGWQIWWVPTARIIHHGAQSTRQVAAAMFLRLYQGKILYFRKNHGPLSAQAYKLILALAAVARLVFSPLAWLQQPSRRQRNLVMAGNYARLLRALPVF